MRFFVNKFFVAGNEIKIKAPSKAKSEGAF